MRKPTISFAIVSFSLLVLSGCNHANQNTYSAAAPVAATPVDSKQAEIQRLCSLKYFAAGSVPGAGLSEASNAYADCMLKYNKP